MERIENTKPADVYKRQDGETVAASMAKGLGNTDFYQILRYIKCPVLLLNTNVHKAIGKNILTKNLDGKAPQFDSAGKFHDAVDDFAAVSYTHLDVYKRQDPRQTQRKDKSDMTEELSDRLFDHTNLMPLMNTACLLYTSICV